MSPLWAASDFRSRALCVVLARRRERSGCGYVIDKGQPWSRGDMCPSFTQSTLYSFNLHKELER
jgi:hypothetical protein